MTELPPVPEALGPLNPAQEAAVAHLEGPLLILAGAGSGKTRVLTRRIAYMLHVGVDPESILAVTFTNKAAAEMKERVAELVGASAKDVWVSTFHSSCCRILRAEAEELGYTRRFAIYDDDDQLRILRQIIADEGYDPKMVPPKAILGRIDHYKNRMVKVEDLVRQMRASVSQALVKVWRAYEEALVASDAMDFNDLIGKTVELFTTRPDVLQKYRDRFHYVLVDEYQDTNRAQYLLLRLLTQERRNLAVVGDDDQSIYGFRGADIRNILDFEQDFPDAKIVRMEQNYRCTDKILDVANAVVSKNADRIEKRLYTETKHDGARVVFMDHPDARAEAAGIAAGVKQLRRRGIRWDDIAVIYRTNATSQPFESAFAEAGIPHRVVGGRQFYARREIRDALAMLRLITNPADDAAFLRIVNVPPRGIGPKTLTGVRENAQERGEPLLKTARSIARGSDRAAKALAGFVALIDDLVEASRTEELPAFLHTVMERSGYAEMLRAEDSREARGRLENLNQLLRDAAAFEPEDDVFIDGPGDLLSAWLDRIALTGADEELPEDGEVTLMTVHCSKGLEYPVVFVANMVEGQFPHARSAEEPGGVDEERRLAYVAFTRAKDKLIVSRSRATLQFDARAGKMQTKAAQPSRFLFGIPLEACDGDVPGASDDLEVSAEAVADPDAGQRVDTAMLRRVVAAKSRPTPRWQPPPPSAPEEEPELPEASYRTRTIESLEDLEPGVRVIHERLGVGEVVQVKPPTVYIRIRGRLQRVGMADPALQLLAD